MDQKTLGSIPAEPVVIPAGGFVRITPDGVALNGFNKREVLTMEFMKASIIAHPQSTTSAANIVGNAASLADAFLAYFTSQINSGRSYDLY